MNAAIRNAPYPGRMARSKGSVREVRNSRLQGSGKAQGVKDEGRTPTSSLPHVPLPTSLEFGVSLLRLRISLVRPLQAVALLAAAVSVAGAATLPLADGVLVYEPGPAPFKAYVKELRTPGGVQVLLDSPADHIHHHGLMLALGADGVDFWTEKPPETMGRQVARAPVDVDGNSLRQSLDWQVPGGTNVLVETRQVVLRPGSGTHPTRVAWESILRPAANRDVRLWGRHYFGLGLRFVRDLDGATEFLFRPGATNRVVRGDERLTPARWCAARGTIGGKPVTVAMFDHPANPRHPAEWFTMARPFAYLSATLGLEKAPMTIPAGQDLRLRWAVALWDGPIAAEAIDAEWTAWTEDKDGPTKGIP